MTDTVWLNIKEEIPEWELILPPVIHLVIMLSVLCVLNILQNSEV